MPGSRQAGSAVYKLVVAALVAVLLSGVLYWPPASLAPVPVAVAATEVVPYQATGWKSQQVAFDGLSGFQASSFDDSGWPTGQAAFGSGGGCSVQSTVHTTWSTDTDLLLRRHVVLTPGTTGVEVSIVVDNDTIGVYWNGTQIGGPLTHEFCASLSQPMTFTVSPSLVTADNVLATRARDRGVESFVDVRVVSGAMGSEPIGDDWEKRENGATGGDPVQTFSGAFLYRFTDLAIPGRGPAPVLARAYNSRDTRVGPLGPGWTHSYAVRLRHPDDGSADILFIAADGNTDRFTRNADETFSPSPATYRTLVRNADGTYLVTEKSLLKWAFDGSGNLTSISDRYGNVSTLGYDASGQLISISDPAGRGALSLGYTNGRLTSVTDWLSPARTVSYGYDASGRLATVTDREGTTTTFAYDGTSSRISMITDARGNVALTLTYDGQGRVGTQKDARGLLTGQATTFGYVVNPDGTRVTTVTSPPTSFEPSFSPTIEDTYDANGWLTGRVARPSSTETLTETYTYDATGNRTSVTDPRGARTDFCYDVSYAGSAISGSRGNLTRRIDPPPTVGANRPVTLVGYDAKDNPIQIVAPKGVASGTSVTCATNLSAAINTSYATDLAYDASGAQLLSITRRYTDPDLGALTAVTKFEYADATNPGLVTRVIPPRGNTGASPDYAYATTFAYFATGSRAGLLESVSDPLLNRATYDYDAVGRVTSTVDPLGNAAGGVPADHRTDVVYDREDRVRFVKLPAPAAGGAQLVTETRYDEVGNPIVRIDAAGQVMTYAYDERDALFRVTESPAAWTDPAAPPAGVITTEYAYDAAGDLARMTRAKGDAASERATDYVSDGRGLVRRETQYPAWPTTTPTLVTAYTYDPNGNRATLVDPLGRTTTYGYDALDWLTAIDYSDAATADVGYAYDADGNRTQMTDGTGTTTYGYDEADRLTLVTSPGPKTVAYRYDRDGNRTKLIYPDATAVTYTFDTASQLTGLTDWASRTTAYTYFADGALKDATNPNGTLATFTYDNARRLTEISHQLGAAVFERRTYTLDPLGNVTAVAGGAGAETTAIVSISTGRAKGNGQSLDSYISGDGRMVVYHSDATNLVTGDTNGVRDIFVHDRLTGTTTLVSSTASGAPGNGASQDGAVSKDGRFVTFRSQASNFVTGDTNGTSWDVFVKDLATGAIERVSVSSSGAQQNSASKNPVISADGRYVAFMSGASNLVPSDTNARDDIFVRDRQTATTTRVSLSSAGVQATGHSDEPAISDDGRFVAFQSDATNLVTADTNAATDVFLHDRGTGVTRRVSVSSAGVQANGRSSDPAIDGDGDVVAWESVASNLVTGDTNAKEDVFVRQTATSTTLRASLSSSGVQGTSASNDPSLSTDGRLVGFASTASNLVAGDSNSRNDSFLRDLTAGTTVRRSLTAAGGQANEASSDPWLSGDGRSLSFRSIATNLVPEDVDATPDVFVRGPGLDASSYAYDRLYRLVSASEPVVGPTTYTYDPAGNRLSRVRLTTTSYTYDRADRITGAGSTAITVDANGNLTARGTDTFAYDGANRLTSATVAGATETYTYDGDGVRFSRQVGANPAIRYVSDVNGGLPVVLDDGTRKYVWGLGLAYAVAGTGLEVVHADRLGSVGALTDATGAVIATYRTDEFGVPTTVTGSSAQAFRFTGEPQDATGLTYLRARYYDPSLGRFLSRDPWAGSTGVPQTLDRYVYVGNNPLTFADPSGLRGLPQPPPPARKSKVLSCGGEAHGALDLVGVINPAADLTNAGLYLCEGDVANALLSVIAVIPGVGDAFKWVGKAVLKALRLGATRFVTGVRVVHHGRVVLEGTVDLAPTLDRIAAGKMLYKQDATVFRNALGLLPSKPLGYYLEFVHPTPGVWGAGPQRVIVGKAGELFYSPDHYATFIPLN